MVMCCRGLFKQDGLRTELAQLLHPWCGGPKRETVEPFQKEKGDTLAGDGPLGHALVIAVFSWFSLLPKLLVVLDLASIFRRTCIVSGCSGIEPLVFNAGFFLAGDAGRAHFPETATGTSDALSFLVQDCHAKLMLQCVGQHFELDIVT